MSDQWGVPQQQPYAPQPQPQPQPQYVVDPAYQQQQQQPMQPQQQYQMPQQSPEQPQQPFYAPQHGGPAAPPQQQIPQQQQQMPQQQMPPQYAPPPAGIPQQGRYSQADAYAQQQAGAPMQPPVPPPAPPVPHPAMNPQVEQYPPAQPAHMGGGGADDNAGAAAGNAVGAASAEPSGASGHNASAGSAGSAGSAAGTVHPANSFATAGAVTSFVPVIGLVLSLAGLVRSRGHGAGKTAARVGVVLSLLFTVAWGAGGYYVYKSTDSKSSDAGCVKADADFLGYSAELQRDASTMASAAKSSGGAHGAAFIAAVRDYQADVAKLVADFDADAAKAGDASLKSSIEAVGADLTGLDTDFGDLATGNYTAAANLMGLNAKLMTDFQHMETVCTKA